MGTVVLAHLNTNEGSFPAPLGAVADSGEAPLVWAWAARALEAWLAGDSAARDFVDALALERLNVWSQGDRRRGIARERANRAAGSLRFDATREVLGRFPRALELAREVQTFTAHERASVNENGRTSEADRIDQALSHAGAALAGMAGARRLWNRALWLDLTRRALLAIVAAAAAQESEASKARAGGYTDEQRRATARAIVVLVMRNRANHAGVHRPQWNAPAVPELDGTATHLAGRALIELTAEGWSNFAATEATCFAAGRAPMHEVAAAARAARLRGWETDRIANAPPEAFDPSYSEAEAEEAAPLPRPKVGQRKGVRS